MYMVYMVPVDGQPTPTKDPDPGQIQPKTHRGAPDGNCGVPPPCLLAADPRGSETMAEVHLSIDGELLKILVQLTCALLAKCFFTNMIALVPKVRASALPPEDSPLYSALSMPRQNFGVTGPGAKSDVKNAKRTMALRRSERVIQNDLENVYMGLLAIWLAALCSTDADSVRLWATAFVACRYAHSVTYLLAVPLLRSLVFLAGAACTANLLLMSLAAVGGL